MNKKHFHSLLLLLLMQACVSKNSLKGEQTVKAEAILEMLNKGENVFLENKTIEGDIDFSRLQRAFVESPTLARAEVNGSFTLNNCIIKGNITGYKTGEKSMIAVWFGKNFSLIDCQVEGEVNLREAFFSGTVNVMRTTFNQKVSMEGALFRANANFSKSLYRGEARFHNCQFALKSNFTDADFSVVSFQGAHFFGEAQCSSMKASGYADFSLVVAHSGIYFSYAEFKNKASFGGAVFMDRFDMNSGKTGDELNFKDTRFGGIARFNKLKATGPVSFAKANFMSGAPEISFDTEGAVLSADFTGARQIGAAPVELK